MTESEGGTNDPSSIGSSFGHGSRTTHEVLGAGFMLEDPLAAVCFCEKRPINVAYIIGQFLWVLAGSDELDWIAFYNQRGRLFSDDGISLRGALGPRLFGGSNGTSQVDRVIERLRQDAGSRRAVCVALDPGDGEPITRDYPCCMAIQFFLRDGRLSSVVFMRSQSAFGVLPYDVSLYALLQAWIAAQLDVPLGPYYHVCATLHVYSDEIASVQRCLEGAIASVRLAPLSDAHRSIAVVVDAEQELRLAASSRDKASVERSLKYLDRVQADSFWMQALVVLIVNAATYVDAECVGKEAIRRLGYDERSLIEKSPLWMSGPRCTIGTSVKGPA